MDPKAVQNSYARWAPVYDRTFGAVTETGRKRAVEYVNTRAGRVLEVGVGTGLSLGLYKPGLHVTGIDYSEDMLEKARDRVQTIQPDAETELRQMDARSLDFPADHFDTVVAMHVLSVVPEPEKVMAEIARVCKPGGKVVITNHFARRRGALAFLERVFSPFADTIGWHSNFEIDTVLKQEVLKIKEQKPLPPLGIMTFLVLEKSASAKPG